MPVRCRARFESGVASDAERAAQKFATPKVDLAGSSF
jgi:hypothetical protein